MGVMNTQSKHTFLLTLALASVLSLSPTAQGEIVVDHQPHNFGGFASDTEFLDEFGTPLWQRLADDFVLDADSTIRAIRYWGFYHQDDPPSTETFRIRFYGARPGDGLPDDSNIISEQSFTDPLREWTGRIIFSGVGPREFVYDVELPIPVGLIQGVVYWVEIVQVGDISTRFRWEDSVANQDGFAVINPLVADWFLPANNPATTAYQLSTVPEPATGMLLLLSCAVMLRFRRGRR
jgi:hypothetical protein